MAVLKTTTGCVEILIEAANPYDEIINVSRGGASIKDQVVIRGVNNPVFVSKMALKQYTLKTGATVNIPSPRRCIDFRGVNFVTVDGITCDGGNDWRDTGFSDYFRAYQSNDIIVKNSTFKGYITGPPRTDPNNPLSFYAPNNAIDIYSDSSRVAILNNKITYPNPQGVYFEVTDSLGVKRKYGTSATGTMNEGITIAAGSVDNMIIGNEIVGPCYEGNYGTAPHNLLEIKGARTVISGNVLTEKTHRIIGAESDDNLIERNKIHGNSSCNPIKEAPFALQMGDTDRNIVRFNQFYNNRGGAIGLPRGIAPESPESQLDNRFYNNDFHHNLAVPRNGGVFIFSFSKCQSGQPKPVCGKHQGNKIFNNLYYLNGSGLDTDVALSVWLGSNDDGSTLLGMGDLQFLNNIILNAPDVGITKKQITVYDSMNGKENRYPYTIFEASQRYPTNVGTNIEYYYTEELRELLTKNRGIPLATVTNVIDKKTIEIDDAHVFFGGIPGMYPGDAVMVHRTKKTGSIEEKLANTLRLSNELDVVVGDQLSLPFVEKPDIGAIEK
jgi:hypothetical protein